MPLPNGERAIVDIRKLRDYCLNPDSPKGCNKAHVFATALGLTVADAHLLRAKLLEIAQTANVLPGERDIYGQRYTIDFQMETKAGRARIRSGWIILTSESVPRLTTCFVKKGKGNEATKD